MPVVGTAVVAQAVVAAESRSFVQGAAEERAVVTAEGAAHAPVSA